MNIRIAAGVALASVAALAGSVAPLAHGSPISFNCSWNFNPPTPDILHGAVIAAGVAHCTQPPEAFHVVLLLEYWDGKRWNVRDRNESTAIPRPTVTLGVRDLDCVRGGWRGEYSFEETVGGYVHKSNNVSATRIIAC